MQFAPTLTADNGAHASAAPVENHFNGPIPYPASFPAPGGGLMFFCALFLYQDKKRVWGVGGKAPHDNGPRHKPAPVENHFNGHQPSGAPVPYWYVLGRMQFAPTLTADNGARPSGAPGRVYGEGQRFKGAAIYLQDDSKIVFNRSKRKTK